MTTVLVVDDVAADRALAGGLIEKGTGYTVTFAASGEEALDRIRRLAPDAVVTDLQMGDLTGLDLVEILADEFPDLPVLLMTAHGSEEIATAALQAGAATYVPKSQLADRLASSLQQVVELFRGDERYSRLLKFLSHADTSFVLENDPKLIPPLIAHLQQQLTRAGFCTATESVRVGIALEEALSNALYHGNLEISRETFEEARAAMLAGEPFDLVQQRNCQSPYRERTIRVQVELTPEVASFTVEDEGPGFDTSTLPKAGSVESWQRAPGRGLHLIHSLMDEVQYNERGNRVTMLKHRTVRQEPDLEEITLED